MTIDIPVRTLRDHGAGLEDEEQPLVRDRTVILVFREDRDRFEVIATGPALGSAGVPYFAVLDRSPEEVRGRIDALVRTWQRTVIDHVQADRELGQVRPYLGLPAGYVADSRALLDSVGARLAEAGHLLFDELFSPSTRDEAGSRDMARLRAALERALRSGEQIITVISESLFAPWGMLYLPPDPDTPRAEVGASWRPEGFWGHRHLVEHSVKAPHGVATRIAPPGSVPVIGLYADTRLDTRPPARSGRPVPIVAPLRQALSAMSPGALTVFETRQQLLHAIADGNRAENITFFVCHAEVSGADDRGPRTPSFALADGDPVTVGEFESNARAGTTLRGSVVLLAACEAGRLGSFHFDSFPVALHNCGANCVLGPQIDLPTAFAREYALALLARFAKPETRLGDVVRDLARVYLDEHHTPLGLVFALHRGLDTHLDYPGRQHAS